MIKNTFKWPLSYNCMSYNCMSYNCMSRKRIIYRRERWICKAGSYEYEEDDPVLKRFNNIGENDISNKRYALSELIKDDIMVISVSEIRDLLKECFYKVMLEMVIIEDKTVVIKIREWCDGDDEDDMTRIVACINQWRNGDLVRKEVLKRIIEGKGNSVEIIIPLKVSFLF